MNYTPNLKLFLTPINDTSTTFLEWRVGINGTDSDSNMFIIDDAFGELKEQNQMLQEKVDIISDARFAESPKTWKDIQDIVRSGKAQQYFSIGDQFIVEELSSSDISVGDSKGITSVRLNESRFNANRTSDTLAGEHKFIFKGKHWRDDEGRIIENMDNLGVYIEGSPAENDQITITITSSPLIFDIIGFNHEENCEYSMTLQLHDVLDTDMVFHEPEATWYIDEGQYPEGLPAGVYYFTLPAGYDESHGGGRQYYFTLTKPVNPNGQVHFNWIPGEAADNCKINTYISSQASEAIESVDVYYGREGTAMPNIPIDKATTNTNSIERTRYGHNRWSKSFLRKWLNNSNPVVPNERYGRHTPYNDMNGFTDRIDSKFLDVLGEVYKTTQNSRADGSELEVTQDTFFILSLPEVYGGTEIANSSDGAAYEYYSKYSNYTSGHTSADSNRVKYKNGMTKRWLLRTAFYDDTTSLRAVYTDGYILGEHCNSATGVAPACAIM